MSLGLQRYKNYFTGEQATAWREMANALDSIAAKIGVGKLAFQDAIVPQTQSNPKVTPSTVPAAASFSVVGQDGKFTIYIQNAENTQPLSPAIAAAIVAAGVSPQSTTILHNIQSCLSVDFDLAHSLTDYGASPQLVHTYQNPNVTLFWRLRSSSDNGKTWNQWQIYSDSTISCGPIGVYSGLLRTAALVPADAAYGPTSNPLSAASGVSHNTATVSIAGFQVQYPFGLITYNSGAITPLLDNTKYYIYCFDPTYKGGAVAYLASVNSPDLTANDSIVFVGTIMTPTFGGGNTSGIQPFGGGGPCFTGSTGVITRDGVKSIEHIVPGDEVLTQRGWRKVSKLLIHDYSGPLHAMGAGEFVTPMHSFWHTRTWVRAKAIWTRILEDFMGKVFNLEIEGDGSDEEQCYTLANGWIAHNFQRK